MTYIRPVRYLADLRHSDSATRTQLESFNPVITRSYHHIATERLPHLSPKRGGRGTVDTLFSA